jgi:hypothetical protein
MKKYTIIIVGLFIILLIIGMVLVRPRPGTTSFQLSGTAGTPFTGFYVQDGHRVAVTATLPWAIHDVDVTEFEFQKTNPTDKLAYEIKRGGVIGRFFVSGAISSGGLGLRGKLDTRSISTQPF